MAEWNDNLLQNQLRTVDAMNIDEFPEYVDFQNSPHHHSQQQQQQQQLNHHHHQQQQTSDQTQQQQQQQQQTQQPHPQELPHHHQQQHPQQSAHPSNSQDFSDFLDGFMDDTSKGAVTAPFDSHSPHIPQHPQMANLHQVNGQNPNMTIHVSPNDIFSSPLVTAQNPSTNGGSFTPLMSPATTPLEHPNRMPGLPDFNMPGAFFSPSNSPLIEATVQSSSSHHNRRASGSRTWRTPNSTPTMLAQSSARVTKTSRSSKPQPRSKMGTPQFPDHESGSSGLGSESVSPEELPDIAMPPPQRTNGTTVQARKASTSSTASTISAPNTPATPASLMNLPPGEKKALLSSTDEKIQNAIRATTSGFVKQPASRSRRSSGASSLQSSPHLTAIKPKPKGIANAAQARISPVIKPKMSPSSSPHIMPMAKERSTTDLSALLASKSNYQNIVEGNHNQLGLSYPDQLSADLTSKKTSHKLAEQGRRNRINIALQELGELVASRNGGQVQSKATTVETAIKFIKDLRKELEVTKAKLAKYEDVSPIKQEEDKIKSGDDSS